MRRAARLPKVDRFETRRRPADRFEMLFRVLHEAEKRVAVWIGPGERRLDRPLQGDNGAFEMAPLVGRGRRGGEASENVRRFRDRVARGLYRREIDDCSTAARCPQQEETRELDERTAQRVMRRPSFERVAHERVCKAQSRRFLDCACEASALPGSRSVMAASLACLNRIGGLALLARWTLTAPLTTLAIARLCVHSRPKHNRYSDFA